MSERRWLCLILFFYTALGFGYSVLMPIWDAPDEPEHYQLALYAARTGATAPRGYAREATQPPLYYWLASVPLRMLDAVDPTLVDFYQPPRDSEWRARTFGWNAENYRLLVGAHVLRCLSLLFGGSALVLVYSAARRLAPGSAGVALATVSLVGLTPQFLHITSSVSNDPLGIVAGAFLFWLLSRICTEELSARELTASAFAALALPPLTKLTVLPMAFAVLLAIVVRPRAHTSQRWFRALVGGLLLASGLLAGMMIFMPTAAENLWGNVLGRALYVQPDALESPWERAAHFVWSYWGIVGILTVRLSWTVMWMLAALAGFGAVASLRLLLPRRQAAQTWRHPVMVVGVVAALLLAAIVNSWVANVWALTLVWLLYRSFKRPDPILPGGRRGWVMVWVAVTLALVVVAKNFLASTSTQGRHLFPSIGAISMLVTGGWSIILLPALHRHLHHFVLWPMLAVNFHFWVTKIIPFYYQPFLD